MFHRFRLLFIRSVCALALVACGSSPQVMDAPQVTQSVESLSLTEGDVAVEELTATVMLTATNEALSSTEVVVKDVYAIGDVARVDEILVRVDEVEIRNETHIGAAQFGNQFVLIHTTVQNTSSDQQEGTLSLDMVAKDAAGQTYPVDAKATLDMLSGTDLIEPAAIETATVGYQVPENVQGLHWIVRIVRVDNSQISQEAGAVVFDIQP